MVEELLPNLYLIRIPLPGSPLGWVNSYVIKGLDRNLVIDTGLNRRECLEAMQAGLGEIEVDLKKTDFYITHMHADHIGLASRLVEDNSTIYINRPDKEYMENWVGWEAITGFAMLNGFPAKELITGQQGGLVNLRLRVSTWLRPADAEASGLPMAPSSGENLPPHPSAGQGGRITMALALGTENKRQVILASVLWESSCSFAASGSSTCSSDHRRRPILVPCRLLPRSRILLPRPVRLLLGPRSGQRCPTPHKCRHRSIAALR